MPVRPRAMRLSCVVWLVALSIFVLAGLRLTPFHGDEPMNIYMSHDFATAFVRGEPARLSSVGPFTLDTDSYLRIINGSLNRYVIGLSWYLRGFTEDALPPSPGWDWGADYASNVAAGNRPPDTLLDTSRLGSALFLALSVAVMFGIAWQLDGPIAAYLASALYVVHPAILLNGRRAMMEGSMLFFGLLTILVAVGISRTRAAGEHDSRWWWIGLAASAGLALASKHMALTFVGGAFGWIVAAELLRPHGRALAVVVTRSVVSGGLAIALFVALSPGLWHDTAARAWELVQLRRELVAYQVEVDPRAPMTPGERVRQVVTQPFFAAPMFYEDPQFADAPSIASEIDRYEASPLSGVRFGPVSGVMLSVMSLFGLASLLRGRTFRGGVLAWLLLTVALLMCNPLPWQRYYLPWIPLATLLAGLGVSRLVALMAAARPREQGISLTGPRPTPASPG